MQFLHVFEVLLHLQHPVDHANIRGIRVQGLCLPRGVARVRVQRSQPHEGVPPALLLQLQARVLPVEVVRGLRRGHAAAVLSIEVQVQWPVWRDRVCGVITGSARTARVNSEVWMQHLVSLQGLLQLRGAHGRGLHSLRSLCCSSCCSCRRLHLRAGCGLCGGCEGTLSGRLQQVLDPFLPVLRPKRGNLTQVDEVQHGQ
mmetsp:Transcript_28197/g.38786  ORF Transcript_28197/g.38786 Transcript_28197/m.38786 type:complete len:200 (-) Transcript_28197:3114-3713(-)